MDIQKAIRWVRQHAATDKCETSDDVLEALQEQAEREKGCEYCKQTITTVKMDFETDSILGENKWFSSTRAPKYCPMCGRRLK